MQTETARLKEEQPDLDNKERYVLSRARVCTRLDARLIPDLSQLQDGHRQLEQAEGEQAAGVTAPLASSTLPSAGTSPEQSCPLDPLAVHRVPICSGSLLVIHSSPRFC